MKATTTIAAIAVAAVAGAAIGIWSQRSHAPAPTTAPATRKVLYWHDPMKPEVKFDKPGKSPFMDMELVPVYAGEDKAEGTVSVSAAARQNLGIRVARVEKRALSPSSAAVGSVAYDEHDIAVVQPRVSGYITRLRIRAPMDRVQRGDALAEVVSPMWVEAMAEYRATLVAPATLPELRDAARHRLIVLGLPEDALRQIEATHTPPEVVTLRAPISGVVTELGVREGAAFGDGTLLFRINGLQRVWVNAQLRETEASGIRPGSPAQVTVSSWPGETFVGRVETLLPQVDATTRTVTARVSVENGSGHLTPGMFAQVSFGDRAGEAQLAVPSEAVIATGERTVVVVQKADGSFAVTPVKTGIEAQDHTVILDGLQEGQSVVLSGQFLIDSEASLKATSTRLAPETSP